MYTVKGLDMKKAAKGQATPAANFCVDERNPNIKACQSWNDYVLYQIKSTGKNGKTFCHYEVVKVMRKKTDKGLKTYVIDRLEAGGVKVTAWLSDQIDFIVSALNAKGAWTAEKIAESVGSQVISNGGNC